MQLSTKGVPIEILCNLEFLEKLHPIDFQPVCILGSDVPSRFSFE